MEIYGFAVTTKVVLSLTTLLLKESHQLCLKLILSNISYYCDSKSNSCTCHSCALFSGPLQLVILTNAFLMKYLVMTFTLYHHDLILLCFVMIINLMVVESLLQSMIKSPIENYHHQLICKLSISVRLNLPNPVTVCILYIPPNTTNGYYETMFDFH